jgi:hypothetical protein
VTKRERFQEWKRGMRIHKRAPCPGYRGFHRWIVVNHVETIGPDADVYVERDGTPRAIMETARTRAAAQRSRRVLIEEERIYLKL